MAESANVRSVVARWNVLGFTINDATYHPRCWEQTRMARSTVSLYDQTRSGPIKRGLERRKL